MIGTARCARMLTAALAITASAGVAAAPAYAGWLPAADLAPETPGKTVGSPSLAIARDGTTYVAFLHFDGANQRAAVVMRSPGGAFGAPRDLSPAGLDASSPAVAVDRQGNATLAWVRGGAIEARFRPAGSDWQDTATVPPPATSTGVAGNGPALAVGDNGGAVVAWVQGGSSPPTTARVVAAVRRPGATSFSAAAFASPAAGNVICGLPRAAIDTAGDIAVIWTRNPSIMGGQYHVESSVKPAAATSFDAFQTHTPGNGNSPCNTDIEMTPNGRVTAMWDFQPVSPTVTLVQFADRNAPFASGAWTGAMQLSATGVVSRRPRFALDDADNGAATWVATDPSGDDQFVSAVRTGLGAFTAPKPLSGAADAGDHAVGVSANGEALAAFIGESNGNDAVFAARRLSGAEFGGVTTIADTPPGGPTVFLDAPSVALDDQGNGFAVWQRRVFPGTTGTAQFAGFDPVAPTITAAHVPAAGTAGQPVGMSATATDRMSVPALQFDFGDGSGAAGGGAQHIYAAAGSYIVTVTATDTAGNKSSTARAIQIAPAPLPAQPTNPGTQPAAAGPNRIVATTTVSWDRLANGRTRIKKLVVEELAGPETVRLTCKSKKLGCRKSANVTLTKHGRKATLTKRVKGMVLRPKAVLTITVTRPGFVARIITYTMVRHRDPKKRTRCLATGATKPTPC